MNTKDKTLLLYPDMYDVKIVMSLDNNHNPEQQAKTLLSIMYRQLPGDVFVEFAKLIHMDSGELERYCEDNE